MYIAFVAIIIAKLIAYSCSSNNMTHVVEGRCIDCKTELHFLFVDILKGT